MPAFVGISIVLKIMFTTLLKQNAIKMVILSNHRL
nr:MAG TPA: hypothetical protein [Caudoviricetes sp.]